MAQPRLETTRLERAAPLLQRIAPLVRAVRSVQAVAWRDIRITTRYKSWFVASFVWPIIFPFSLVFVGKGLAGPGGEGIERFESLAATPDYASFLVIGSLVWMFVNINLWMGGLSLMTDRERGTFDTHWTMPVSKLALVVGATVASLVLNFVPMIIAIAFYASIGWLQVSGDPLQILLAIAAVLPFLLGFLLCFSAITIRFRQAGMLVQVMRTLFSLLCGLQFPLSVLPAGVQAVGRVIPLTHFIDLVRAVVIAGDRLGEHAASVAYLVGSGLVMAALGAGSIIAAFGAIFTKNALEYVRYPMNVFFGLVMPVIWFLPMYFLIVSFAPEGQSAGLEAWVGTSNFFAYLPIGLIVGHVVTTIFWNLGFALKRLMDIGVLETVWSCPVPRIVSIVGESLFSMARLVFEVAIVIVVYRYLYGFVLPASIAASLRFLPPFVLLMYGFGIGFASLVLLVKDANTLVDTSSFLISGITGTQNPPQVFPRFLVAIAVAIPITHVVDLLRVETLGIEPLADPALSLAYFLGASILFPLAGVLIFMRVERRSRRLGNLHVH